MDSSWNRGGFALVGYLLGNEGNGRAGRGGRFVIVELQLPFYCSCLVHEGLQRPKHLGDLLLDFCSESFPVQLAVSMRVTLHGGSSRRDVLL